jgi:hypothetical protein
VAVEHLHDWSLPGNSYSDSNANTNCNTNANTDANANSYAERYTDTDTDSGHTDTDSYCHTIGYSQLRTQLVVRS